MPQPGSEADQRMKERKAKKRAKKGIDEPEAEADEVPEAPRSGQRHQPKKTTRAERRTSKPDEMAAVDDQPSEAQAAEPIDAGQAAPTSGAKAKPKDSAKAVPTAAASGKADKPGKGTASTNLADFGRGTTGAKPGTPTKGGQRNQPKKSSRKKRK